MLNNVSDCMCMLCCVCLQKVLKEELGEKWRDQLADFDPQPLAAASIGQVHSVVLHSGQCAAMKIQVLRITRDCKYVQCM